jgi:hypothetical protein
VWCWRCCLWLWLLALMLSCWRPPGGHQRQCRWQRSRCRQPASWHTHLLSSSATRPISRLTARPGACPVQVLQAGDARPGL